MNDVRVPDGVNTNSRTWPYVLAFAVEMEKKLAENAHKDGHRPDCEDDHDGACASDPREPGWLDGFDPLDCMGRIYDEANELRVVSYQSRSDGSGAPSVRETLRRDVTREAADVANFCMMLACITGDLVPAAPVAGASDE
jgi:hypothetical protein